MGTAITLANVSPQQVCSVGTVVQKLPASLFHSGRVVYGSVMKIGRIL